MSHNSSAAILLKQFKELTNPKKAIPSFHIQLEDDDIYKWTVGVIVLSEDSPYHGGYFRAQMTFPDDYPFSPPKFRFMPTIFHPNVYKDGLLCISILHRSGDETANEPDAETWSPAQSVESVLISIVSLLSDPNVNSAANVDAAVLWRKDRAEYNKRVAQDVADSKNNIPQGFVMPTESEAYVAPKDDHLDDDVVDDEFWYDSEDDMGESMGEMEDVTSDGEMDDEDDE